MALVFVATITGRWFVKHRGVVTGVLTAAGATGQLIFLPVLAALAGAHGWRTAALTVTGAALLVVPLVLLLMRDHPADVGLTAYGAPAGHARSSKPAPAPGAAARRRRACCAPPRVPARSGCWSAASRSAAPARTGWSAPTSSRPRTTTACRRRPRPACSRSSASSTSSAPSRRAGSPTGTTRGSCSARYYALRGLSLFVLPGLIAASAHPSILVFVIFYGLDWVATVPPTIALCRQHFGADGPIVFGWVFASHQIGAAMAATGGRARARRPRRLQPGLDHRRRAVPVRRGHVGPHPADAGGGPTDRLTWWRTSWSSGPGSWAWRRPTRSPSGIHMRRSRSWRRRTGSPPTRPGTTPASSTPASTTSPARLKAQLCRAGATSMVEFCQTYDIPYQICGKLIVAADRRRAAPADRAVRAGRGQRAGRAADRPGGGARATSRTWPACRRSTSPVTGIVDYSQVCRTLAELVEKAGGTVTLGARVTAIRPDGDRLVVESTAGADPRRPPGQLRRTALRPGGPAGRAGATGAHHPVPRRVLRAATGSARPGPWADLPGAGPAVPVPRRTPDPDDRRQRARRPQRGAGPGPRGVLVGPDPAARRRRRGHLRRAVAAGPQAPAVRADRGAPVAVHGDVRGRAWPGSCRSSTGTTSCGPARAYGPRRSPGTAAWSTTS